MRFSRPFTLAATTLLLAWLAFVAAQYTRHHLKMRQIARELGMESRSFQIVSEPLAPPTAVDGEERLLVVGQSADDFLLCSIVRNPRYADERGRWKVDVCFRPDLEPEHPRLAIWEPLDHFPTAADLIRFRSLALQQPWVTWDCPEGSDPVVGD